MTGEREKTWKEKRRLGWRRDFWYVKRREQIEVKEGREDKREGERWELEIFMPRSSTCTRLTAWSVSELDTAISSYRTFRTGSLEPRRRSLDPILRSL